MSGEPTPIKLYTLPQFGMTIGVYVEGGGWINSNARIPVGSIVGARRWPTRGQ